MLLSSENSVRQEIVYMLMEIIKIFSKKGKTRFLVIRITENPTAYATRRAGEKETLFAFNFKVWNVTCFHNGMISLS